MIDTLSISASLTTFHFTTTENLVSFYTFDYLISLYAECLEVKQINSFSLVFVNCLFVHSPSYLGGTGSQE